MGRMLIICVVTTSVSSPESLFRTRRPGALAVKRMGGRTLSLVVEDWIHWYEQPVRVCEGVGIKSSISADPEVLATFSSLTYVTLKVVGAGTSDILQGGKG